ncbi:MAG: DedA family protein [Phycisphaeraceae bacterium]
MEQWLVEFADKAPYLAIFGVLLISGFGLPLPEDIPLILAGYLCGEGYANPWIMFPGCFLAIVGADGIVFFLGRKYGHHVPKLPLLRRFLTEARLSKTEAMLHTHGGKFIFMARFLPGLRTAAFFTAGSFKVAYWKFLVYDGSAALISVPVILGLAYFFSDHIHQVREWVQNGQIIGVLVLLAAIFGFFAIKHLVKKWLARPVTEVR